MDLGAAGLSRQPFPIQGRPLAIVAYQSQRTAMEALRETHEHATGLSLLQGPTLSGKSVLIRSFIESIDPECAVALVDGKGLNTTTCSAIFHWLAPRRRNSVPSPAMPAASASQTRHPA